MSNALFEATSYFLKSATVKHLIFLIIVVAVIDVVVFDFHPIVSKIDQVQCQVGLANANLFCKDRS